MYVTESLTDMLRRSARESHQDGSVDQDTLKAIREAGLLALCVPVAYRGRGQDITTVNHVIEKIATANPSVAIMLYLHCAVVARIDEYGTEDQKKRWFTRIVDDAWLAASAWSEAGGPADKRSLSTVARPQSDGSWRMTGGKTFSTSSTVADFFIVLAQLPERESPSGPATAGYGRNDQLIALVPADADGVRVPPDALPMSGMRGSGTGMVQFVDAEVDAGDVLCQGPATPQAIGLPHRLGLTLGAVSVGAAQAAVELLWEHHDRRGDQNSGHAAAGLEVRVRAARAMVSDLGGRGPFPDPDAAYAAKVFTSTTAQSVCQEVRSLLGSAGYLQHHEINRVSLDADAVAHMGPPNHLCLDLLAQSLGRGH